MRKKDDNVGGGGGGGGKKGGDGGVGGGEVLFFLSFNLFNLFLIAKSTPGGPGSFFRRSPAVSFFHPSSSLSKDPYIGFSARKVDISPKKVRMDFVSSKYSFLLDLVFA